MLEFYVQGEVADLLAFVEDFEGFGDAWELEVDWELCFSDEVGRSRVFFVDGDYDLFLVCDFKGDVLVGPLGGHVPAFVGCAFFFFFSDLHLDERVLEFIGVGITIRPKVSVFLVNTALNGRKMSIPFAISVIFGGSTFCGGYFFSSCWIICCCFGYSC